MSESFTYVFDDGSTPLTLTVGVDPTPTDSTGEGNGYAVTSINGMLGTAPITGEVGSGGTITETPTVDYDNTIFTGSGGVDGNVAGIDNDGLEFTIAGNEYNLFSANSQLYLYEFGVSTYPGSALTLVPTDAPCYCTGTMIRTDRGDRAVETLTAGDVVLARENGQDVPRPVVWVGRRHLDLASHPNPSLVMPVRILPGALAEGVPSRTLRVSPDHGLLLDGCLVQARQLVNGGSIAVETAASVTYVHVELERHGILLAEGAEAESYLATGNRHQFENEAAIALHPVFERTDHPAACAPLATAEDVVRPIWDRLASRSDELGVACPVIETTAEPELRLLLSDGTVLLPQENGDRRLFAFDPHSIQDGPVRLCSNAASPSDLAPWCDDRRALGVKVSSLRVWTPQDGLDATELSLHGSMPGAGWWDQEPDGRWTDGQASLHLPPDCMLLEVTLAATARYPLPARSGMDMQAPMRTHAAG